MDWVWTRLQRIRRHVEKAGAQLTDWALWPLPSQAKRWVFLATIVETSDGTRLEQLRLLTRRNTVLLVSSESRGEPEERLKLLLEATKPLAALQEEEFIRFPALPQE